MSNDLAKQIKKVALNALIIEAKKQGLKVTKTGDNLSLTGDESKIENFKKKYL